MIKRTTSDGHFSDCIRIREDFTCENPKCKKYIPEGDRYNAQCCHIVSRKFKSTRHSPNNCLMLCGNCHADFTADPVMFTTWLQTYLGQDHLDKLQQEKHRIIKKVKNEEKDKAKHYLKEKKRMIKLRDDGLTGRIEFRGYYDDWIL